MALPSVLQHIQLLEATGLVRTEKVGRVRTCHLDAAALGRAESWLAERRAAWEALTDRLENYLNDTIGEDDQ